MSSHGIKDRVAIIGMGCTPFREHWDKGTDDLMIDAAQETFASAGIAKDDIDAFWFGTAQSAMSGVPMASALKLEGKPAQQMLRLMEALEDYDDTRNVWSNFDVEEKEIEASLA